jgi:hypothetical protein
MRYSTSYADQCLKMRENHRICFCKLLTFFLTHLFFGITQEWQTYKDFSMRYSTSYVDPGHNMREHLCFCVFWLQRHNSGPGKGLHRQSNLPQSLHRLLATVKNLTHYIISIAVLENVPPDTGLQNRDIFSTLNIGLAGTGNWTLASHQRGKQRRKTLSHPLRLKC